MKRTLSINGRDYAVYEEEEHGGPCITTVPISSFWGDRPQTFESPSKFTRFLLQDGELSVYWGETKQARILEIIGPDAAHGHNPDGTARCADGREYPIKYSFYRLKPEQAEKVFRERMIEATVQGHAVTAQRMAVASAAPIKALSEGLADAASVARSGLLIAGGPLVEGMEADEREFYNRLVQKDPKTSKALSYRALAERIGCSHSAVKRRREALERKYPELRRFIAAGRKELAKGAHPDALTSGRESGEDEDGQ